ncbi:50S ribosome-binding GTPase [Patescibacteria group bacterium]|jgi:guanylate kinase|nr:50S ribosome-binding GTPase [Patescibacteria group bacterium]
MNPIFILVGPSGVGKSTVQERLLQDRELHLSRAITSTTRAPRPGEIEGVDFYFLTNEAFEGLVKTDGFVEWVETFGRRYGTTKQELEARLTQGPVLMVADIRGARSIKSQYPNTHILFLDAPREALVRRIEERPGTTPEDLERRLKKIDEEKAGAKEADVTLYNPDGELETTVENVRRFISQQLAGSLH